MAIAIPNSATAPARARHRSRVMARLRSDWAARIAVGWLFLLMLIAVFGDLIMTHDPNAQALSDSLAGPSGDHWLGTDRLGRDLFSRLISGTRVNVIAAFEGVGIGAILGIPLGLVAGYVGGAVERVLNFVAETLMSMPALFLALAIVGIRGRGITNAMIAIGIVLAPRMFRVARAAALSIRPETYVEAARSGGCSVPRILGRHVLPNASGPLVVQASFAVGLAAVAEASLSFLGLGVQPPNASWGSMIKDAYETISKTSFNLFPPSLMLALTVLAFALLGDALRDALGQGRRVSDR